MITGELKNKIKEFDACTKAVHNWSQDPSLRLSHLINRSERRTAHSCLLGLLLLYPNY